jgi:hypothetical protein
MWTLYIGKSISKIQMDVELKETRVLIWQIFLFLNIISLYTEALVPFHKPLKNQQHKILWAAVGTRRDFPGPVSPGRLRWMTLGMLQ